MKKIWKMKKSKEAVSPVIATILMVAITVVLAAVLYVMVMGFGSNPESTPTASLIQSQTTDAHTEKIQVADISDPQEYANMKVSLVIAGTSYVAQIASGVIPNADFGAVDLPANWVVTFVDVAGDGKVTAGDYFLIENPAANAGNSLSLNLLYGSDAKSIAQSTWTAP